MIEKKSASGQQPDSPIALQLARQRGRILPIAIIVLLILMALPAVWAWFTLSYAYSEGERAGVLQKFSRKGWICKTYEGELAQYVVAGVTPQIWTFSTRDPKVAAEL